MTARPGQIRGAGWTYGALMVADGGTIVPSDALGAIRVPVGTTADRPASPVDGETRYSTDNGVLEFALAGTFERCAVASVALYKRAGSASAYSTPTPITFDTPLITTPDVTTTDNTVFTINRGGVWMIFVDHYVHADSPFRPYAAGLCRLRIDGINITAAYAADWQHTNTSASPIRASSSTVLFTIENISAGSTVRVDAEVVPDSSPLDLVPNGHWILFVHLG